MSSKDFVKPFRVEDGSDFRFKDYDPADTLGLESKDRAKELLEKGIERLNELQEMLYAQDRWGLLLIFQGMDAAGKDGTIKHVMSGVNPQGCQVFSFKAPSDEELDHDFLWRTSRCLPERGRIGIFNRSYYEEVLIIRVHPEYLAREKMPRSVLSKKIWDERFEDIVNFEKYLTRNGIAVLKFCLNISKAEQRRRFLERLELSEKHWKFSPADAREREFWDDYMAAYEAMIRHTSSEHAPWHIVPADKKWFSRLVVAETVINTLQSLDLEYPEVTKEQQKELEAARKVLLAEKEK